MQSEVLEVTDIANERTQSTNYICQFYEKKFDKKWSRPPMLIIDLINPHKIMKNLITKSYMHYLHRNYLSNNIRWQLLSTCSTLLAHATNASVSKRDRRIPKDVHFKLGKFQSDIANSTQIKIRFSSTFSPSLSTVQGPKIYSTP